MCFKKRTCSRNRLFPRASVAAWRRVTGCPWDHAPRGGPWNPPTAGQGWGEAVGTPGQPFPFGELLRAWLCPTHTSFKSGQIPICLGDLGGLEQPQLPQTEVPPNLLIPRMSASAPDMQVTHSGGPTQRVSPPGPPQQGQSLAMHQKPYGTLCLCKPASRPESLRGR